jgi:hypothetical protein
VVSEWITDASIRLCTFFWRLTPHCVCQGGPKRDMRWQRCFACYEKCVRLTQSGTCPAEDLCRKAYERCIRTFDPIIFPPGFACR